MSTIAWLEAVETLRSLIGDLNKLLGTCSLVYVDKDLKKMIGHVKEWDELYYLETSVIPQLKKGTSAIILHQRIFICQWTLLSMNRDLTSPHFIFRGEFCTLIHNLVQYDPMKYIDIERQFINEELESGFVALMYSEFVSSIIRRYIYLRFK